MITRAMNYILVFLMFIMWLLVTLILALTILGGLIVFMSFEDEWVSIGKKLVSYFTEK